MSHAPHPARPNVTHVLAQVYKHMSGLFAITECGLVFRRIALNVWEDCQYKPEFVRRTAEPQGHELITVDPLRL